MPGLAVEDGLAETQLSPGDPPTARELLADLVALVIRYRLAADGSTQPFRAVGALPREV